MTKEELFETWAPAGALWSAWCKPVLFATYRGDSVASAVEEETADLGFVSPASGGLALVLDLPGALGVTLGLRLAHLGYRPVPLYNALPGPRLSTQYSLPTAVPVAAIQEALARGCQELTAIALAPDAPPAFLLDANRRRALMAGSGFDNRSVSFPTDFPSGTLLRAHGIEEALVVVGGERSVSADLAHTLRRWQAAGVRIALKSLTSARGPEPVTLAPLSPFRLACYRLLESFGMKRSILGGFGGMLSSNDGSGWGGGGG